MALNVLKDSGSLAERPIEPRLLGCHTAVLAQSGSGKSFFVGRLVEELLLKTRARVLVLDPNSDFVCLPKEDPKIWSNLKLRQWFYSGETADAFRAAWAEVSKLILSNRNLPDLQTSIHPLLISWGSLDDWERAAVAGIDPAAQAELFSLFVLTGEIAKDRWDEREDEYHFEFFRSVANEVCDCLLGNRKTKKDISTHPLIKTLRATGPSLPLRFQAMIGFLETFTIWAAEGEHADDVTALLRSKEPSLTVIDLLSLDKEPERLALTSRVLESIWKMARDAYSERVRDIDTQDVRVPTFIVIDEAHNLVPLIRRSPASERVAAELIRIAAEGRKFGIFLILITQRPRKLDPSLLSECDALFLLRMTNDSDITAASELFGVAQSTAQQAKALALGDVLPLGRIGTSAVPCHAAPRRTREGGKSLDDNYWTEVAPLP